MDGMNLVLQCLAAIEEEICRGRSSHDAALAWLNVENEQTRRGLRGTHDVYNRTFLDQFATVVRWLEEDQPLEFSRLARLEGRKNELGRQREQLFLLLESGKRGASVLTEWRTLRREVEMQLEMDLKAHVESLPLKMLLPLLFFLFPAFLILLFGPITRAFLSAI